MLSRFGFQAETLCVFACLLIPAQVRDDMERPPPRPQWKEIHNPDQDVPEQFDARDNWPDCESIKETYDKGQCNSSWAYAVATMLTDRVCIQNKTKFEFSIEDIIACCENCFKASHSCLNSWSTATYALDHWMKKGIPSTECKPLTSKSSVDSIIPECKEECTNLDSNTSTRILGIDVAEMYEPWDIKQIQLEIMLNGPVATRVGATAYFINDYQSGVYKGTETEKAETYVVVKIIGWGTENGIPYWLATNFMGMTWGEGGFFKIIRGENIRDFETDALAAYFHKLPELEPEPDTEVPFYDSSTNISSGSKFVLFMILFSFLINYI